MWWYVAYCCWLLSRFYFMILFFLSYLYLLQAISFIEAYLFWVITNETAFDVLRIPLLYNVSVGTVLDDPFVLLVYFVPLLFIDATLHLHSFLWQVCSWCCDSWTSFRPNVRLDSGKWNSLVVIVGILNLLCVLMSDWMNVGSRCVRACVFVPLILPEAIQALIYCWLFQQWCFSVLLLSKRETYCFLHGLRLQIQTTMPTSFFFLECVVKCTHYLWDSCGGNGC